MKKIDVLAWGVQHIASNHGADCSTEYKDAQYMSIVGTSVPTLSDARMLCEDLGIKRNNCYSDDFWNIIVIIVDGWADTIGQEEYVPGLEMWKRYGVTIGS